MSLRGWLSDVYFPALLDRSDQGQSALLRRLGGRATVDAPVFGRASGMAALERYLAEMAAWLRARQASFEKVHFTTGVDRDVTEGMLQLSFDEKTVDLPVAVVAERRPSREVELRLYYSTQPIDGTYAVRPRLVARDEAVLIPSGVSDHLDALKKADIERLLEGFEAEGSVREARGVQHKKGADLRDFYDKLLAGGAFGGGVEMEKGGAADDGRTCALEYTVVKMCGREVTPQAGLAVYERGDSGLLRSLRIYDGVEV